MEKFLEGKAAIVTGGTRGIGFAIAGGLLSAGAAVAISGRSDASVSRAVVELSRRGKVVGKPADVGDCEEVERFFEFVDRSFGGLDILVNNAGVGVFRPLAELTIEEWHRTIETNLTGVYLCSRQAIPRLRNRSGGSIINISSLAGKNPLAGGAAYNASKFGLNGMSEAMMLDYRHDDIRVSYVMPGSVDTEFGSLPTGAGWKIAPEDIAEIVLMLLRMPQRTLISRVEVRPSKPPKGR